MDFNKISINNSNNKAYLSTIQPHVNANANININTPYQGKRRCFGEFECFGCGKKWKSAKSRANEAQPCTKCFQLVFPVRQKSFDSLYETMRRQKYLHLAMLDAQLAAARLQAQQK
jgi:hypothetical protein